MTKGFEPAVSLPVLQPSREEQLATLALCRKYGWELSPELQRLQNELDIQASAGFQRPPATTIEERAAAIKTASALMFESKNEPTEVPEFISQRTQADISRLESQIAALRLRGEHE